ncbi:MAG: hypothetical protein GX998_11415 [Firmicutes bacterium]|nr:hypothetical protein [Bacillota bacterium]
MLEKWQPRGQGDFSQIPQKWVRIRRQRLAGSLVLIFLVIAAAGCGPKGFIKGEAIGADGAILARQRLVANAGGKTHMITTASDGSFEISGIALGSQEVKVSFDDPATGQRYHWARTVQVGIQGVRIRVEFSGAPENPDQLMQAVWRQLARGEWEAARKNLESLSDDPVESQPASTCELAWGWLYLRSGESYAKARQHFQNALTLGRAAEAQVGLAGVEAATGQYGEATIQLEQALEREFHLQLPYLDLNTGDLQAALASLYLQAGDEAKALAILHQSEAASPMGQKVKNDILALIEG